MNTIKDKIKNTYIRFLPKVFKARSFAEINKFTWKDVNHKNIEAELLLIKMLLKKDSIFIDVGANIGEYIHCASKIISYKNIYAFEPGDWANDRLQRIFPKINLFKAGLSDKKGTASFKIPIADNNQEIYTRGTLKVDFVDTLEKNAKLVSITTNTLDSFCSDHNINNISLIKIDVEGFENKVIIGGKESIKKMLPVLIIEIEQRHYSEPLSSIIKGIKTLGYKCYYLDASICQLTGFKGDFDVNKHQNPSNHGLNKNYINNFIFLPTSGVNMVECDKLNKEITAFL